MILHESPCGEVFSTADDASAHQWHCDQCAGVLESLETELDAMERISIRWATPRRYPVEVMLPGAEMWGAA